MNNNLFKIEKDKLIYFVSEGLSDLGFVKHFFSTRVGGVSTGNYSSLNLGLYTEDDNEKIKLNFKKIFETADMNMDKLVFLKQVHGDQFYVVSNGNYSSVVESSGDAIITGEKGIPIGIFTADCAPILLVDKENKLIAAVHAGWKGTYLKIAERVLNHMFANMGTNPVNVLAVIGPSIGPCCFEVKEDVADKFEFTVKRNNKIYVDLWKENRKQLLNMGLLEKNIAIANLCTYCNNDLFYSYRRDNGNTGRLAAFIEIV
ncbi:polyphenol oxidase [Fervidicella metallireducens AeB]|uniref:Purine nucleoside phosphorylase n=1 Tax=Fervidicella metallireducens AeB TaxID=1403537 RepID=A0A017RUG4_9CLOT|nr:peptidoglycan editing factor PgeF [Fervidicella metallireducens]EYE88418.1 polyphenol oxidase [Fervidicella metallireducens AeB]